MELLTQRQKQLATEEHYLKKELELLITSDKSILQFVCNAVTDGIWYLDLENPTEEWLCPRFWFTLGYDPSEIRCLAAKWAQMIFPQDLAAVEENLIKHCQNPDYPYDQITRYYHKNGSTIWMRCRGMAIRNKAGVAIRMFGANIDISDLKNAELKLQVKAKELESINQSLEQFSLVVSHDLRAPLAKIKGLIEKTGKAQGCETVGQCKSILDKINDQVEQMQGLIQDMLLFAESSKTDMLAEEVDIKLVMNKIIDFMPLPKNSKVIKSINEVGNAKTYLAPLCSVLQNLIFNSIKHHPKKECLKISIECYKRDGQLVITIADNGPGISAKTKAKLFEFCDENIRGIKVGGFGLAIVKKLIDRVSGDIKINDTKGSGCSITIYWPILSD